jgi:hypothetical protein
VTTKTPLSQHSNVGLPERQNTIPVDRGGWSCDHPAYSDDDLRYGADLPVRQGLYCVDCNEWLFVYYDDEGERYVTFDTPRGDGY